MKMKHAADFAEPSSGNDGYSVSAMKRGYSKVGAPTQEYPMDDCEHHNTLMTESVDGFLPRAHGFSR